MIVINCVIRAGQGCIHIALKGISQSLGSPLPPGGGWGFCGFSPRGACGPACGCGCWAPCGPSLCGPPVPWCSSAPGACGPRGHLQSDGLNRGHIPGVRRAGASRAPWRTELIVVPFGKGKGKGFSYSTTCVAMCAFIAAMDRRAETHRERLKDRE